MDIHFYISGLTGTGMKNSLSKITYLNLRERWKDSSAFEGKTYCASDSEYFVLSSRKIEFSTTI